MKTEKNRLHPVSFFVISIINKMFQHPEIYPIKYYRKSDRFKKGKQYPF